MTPEERLEKVQEALQQNDVLGAELEAKKLVEKHPDEPEALVARQQLAQIYTQDGRIDEAATEYQNLLDRLPPGSPHAIRILSLYNQILKQQKRFPEAQALVEKYEKEFTTSPEVMMNMRVARADLKIAMGETSAARDLLREAMEMTTHPVAQMQFRELYVSSFVRENNTTGAIEYLREEVAGDAPADVRRQLAYQLAGAQSQMGDYPAARQALEQATTMTDAVLSEELDRRAQAQQLLELANLYDYAGNLAGAQAVLSSVYESNADPAVGPEVVPALFRNLIRQGKNDEALAFIRKAADRYKNPQLTEQVAQVEAAAKAGKLDQKDTSPLVLQFAGDPPIVPANLPQADAAETTATAGEQPASPAGETTGSASAPASASEATTAPAPAEPSAAAPAPAEPASAPEPASAEPAPSPAPADSTASPAAADASTSPSGGNP